MLKFFSRTANHKYPLMRQPDQLPRCYELTEQERLQRIKEWIPKHRDQHKKGGDTLGSDFNIRLLSDDSCGGHCCNEANDCGPRVAHKGFSLRPEVVYQKSCDRDHHCGEQGDHVREVSVLGEKREKAKGYDGVAAEQTIDAVGVVDGVNGELKEG